MEITLDELQDLKQKSYEEGYSAGFKKASEIAIEQIKSFKVKD